jgi:hypothetical protein
MKKARPRTREARFIVKFDDDRTERILITEGMILTGESLFSIAKKTPGKWRSLSRADYLDLAGWKPGDVAMIRLSSLNPRENRG